MSRLPTPGQDDGTWGDVLNDYLSQSLDANGLLKASSVGNTQLAANSVTAANIADNSIPQGKIQSLPADLSAQSDRISALETPPVITLTDGATVTTDASLGHHFRLSAAGDRTLAAPTNPTDGQRIIWEITASGADRTLTLASGAGGFAFGSTITSISLTPSGTTDYIGAIYNMAADRWRVIAYTKGY